MKRGNPWLQQVPNSIDPEETTYGIQAPPARRGLFFVPFSGNWFFVQYRGAFFSMEKKEGP